MIDMFYDWHAFNMEISMKIVDLYIASHPDNNIGIPTDHPVPPPNKIK